MIPEDLTEGIVQILRHDGTVAGTGFIISNNLIATCAHVIQAADAVPGDKVRVRFYLNRKEVMPLSCQRDGMVLTKKIFPYST